MASQPAPQRKGSGTDSGMASPQARERGHPVRWGLLQFCPHRLVETVLEIDADELWMRGIRGVILDLDNTLVRWQQEDIAEEVVEWLRMLKERGVRLAILSNSFRSRRSARIAKRLDAVNIDRARKPALAGFRRAMEAMGTEPATTAVVGDQMFTDVWGGNRAGIYTIMVHRIHRREFLYTRFVSRPPERLLLRLFRRRGHLEEQKKPEGAGR